LEIQREARARKIAESRAGGGRGGGDAFVGAEVRGIVGDARLQQPRHGERPGAAVPAPLRERRGVDHHRTDEGRGKHPRAADARRQPVRLPSPGACRAAAMVHP
jgi:hypothetical protein